MAPIPEPVHSDEELPEAADVVIIGGGIVGCSTALELAEAGRRVTLCEKGIIAGEQSSRNWGWVRQTGRDPREIPLILESMKIWRGLNKRTGRETGFTPCGIAYLCTTQKQLSERENWLETHARDYQLSSRMISAEQARALAPEATADWIGGLYTPDDGRGEAQLAAPAIAQAAQAAGADIFQQCAVRGIETTAGRISAVVTEKGSIKCEAVVLAGGAWSRHFCDRLGIRLPQLTVVSSVMRTEPVSGLPETTMAGEEFAFRKRLDGGYNIAHRTLSVADITPQSFRFFKDFLPALKSEYAGLRFRLGGAFIDSARMPKHWQLDQVSPFETCRILNPKPVEKILRRAHASAVKTFPQFANTGIAERWGGAIDVTPDAVPVLSPVDDHPGFFIATGLSGHGFGLGPGAGRLMADLVLGRYPIVDPAPFRYSRYTDGSKISIIGGF